MTISILNLPKLLFTTFWTLGLSCFSLDAIQAQDMVPERNPTHDDQDSILNMDATYNRPFMTKKGSAVAIGGYLEANAIHTIEEGLTEGLMFQARRMSIFMSSSIGKRLSFLTELEIEDGGKTIGIEFASMDVALHPLFNLRGGIIMNPIGAFNENHDGPKWEFVERPDMAVQMLPATWSNAGFGIFGKIHHQQWILGYEAYLTNGFDGSIIDNEMHKTYLPATKANRDRFEESFGDRPLTTAKIAIKNRRWGEIGFSYMGGQFNRTMKDGLQIAPDHLRLHTYAIDFSTKIPGLNTALTGEGARIYVDVPASYTQQYGNQQQGFFIDVVQPIIQKPMFGWDNARINLSGRLDYVDWNVGTFRETGTAIGDHQWAVTPSISFRPSGQTVFRFNYRYQWTTDILNNPAELSASWLFGFSTYF